MSPTLPNNGIEPPQTATRAGGPLQGTGLAFTILAIVQATLIFTITFINVPLPKIASEFALSPANLLLVTAAYGLPFSGLLLFGGRLADRYRGRQMFGVGLSIFGLASMVAAFAPNLEVLVGMRFAQGVGGALTAPAAMALLRTLFPQTTAFGKAMATSGGLSVLGPTVGLAALMSVAVVQADVVVGYAWALGTTAVVYVIAARLAMVLLYRPSAQGLRGCRPIQAH